VRRSLNENPVVQVALVGLLAVAVAFLLMTRVLNRDEGGSLEPEPSSATTTAPATDAASSTDASASTAPATPTAPASGVPPATGAAAAPAAATGAFVAGPGLPAEVVKAYASGKPVVILITRRAGIEDKRLRAMVSQARGVGDSVVFTSYAHDIARYSRITRGVDVSRVPALVVLRPRKLSEGAVPEATVSYGFRGPESVEQAVRDALYKGRDDIPYYPE